MGMNVVNCFLLSGALMFLPPSHSADEGTLHGQEMVRESVGNILFINNEKHPSKQCDEWICFMKTKEIIDQIPDESIRKPYEKSLSAEITRYITTAMQDLGKDYNSGTMNFMSMIHAHPYMTADEIQYFIELAREIYTQNMMAEINNGRTTDHEKIERAIRNNPLYPPGKESKYQSVLLLKLRGVHP